jgi:hypothetical protein
MISREIWWTNQELSPVNIIPSWFSMLIYHMGDEQLARWWPQFRDVVSLHGHDHDHHHHHHVLHQGVRDRTHTIIVSNTHFKLGFPDRKREDKNSELNGSKYSQNSICSYLRREVCVCVCGLAIK